MLRILKVGDKVKTQANLAERYGVIVQCQPASVFMVQCADGMCRYFSGSQLELVCGMGTSSDRDRIGEETPGTNGS